MQNSFVIFPAFEPESWSVARIAGQDCQIVTLAESSGLGCPINPINEALAKLGYQDEGLLLALPSRACLCAVIDETGFRNRAREAARRFRFESQIPLAIEDAVMDFIHSGAQSLGIAAALDLIRPLVDTLESEGIAVASICPAALLIADQICQKPRSEDIDGILCVLDGHLDWIRLTGGRICAWSLLPLESARLESHLLYSLLGTEKSFTVLGIDLPAELAGLLSKRTTVQLMKEPSDEAMNLAARAADRILTDGALPPIELRRGALAMSDPLRPLRVPLQVVFAAAVLLLVVLGVSLLWRAGKFSQQGADAMAKQLAAFHQALPTQTPPPILTSRLQSEEKRLQGLNGAASALPPTFSVLPLLRDTLGGLPGDLRFRLLELRFEPQRMYLEGQTLDHGSADRIAAALRQATGLQVDPPHTEQPTGEDVSFTISASNAALADYGEPRQ